ncbi:Tryptophan synthase beta subunit-like PLP-dependent enzymes superfamily [Ostreococcus tauri]|uniref:Tryptophan synthase beta subunit-like PLP-dependent enzymes superfamily n=2 Tax=Ostreococcus tauri TaxID=70448 RepID=A0A090MCB6_OSTTA|nr:Tryptophan synthase beta subunit-like PLP-dependent enzymes superfamily [Ostreococcus tauri]CEF99754.1 Tryptophan synthase beta subunit-like PLP-dependent enzymes superfamily [Ostreococcus tauri]|eukprot:XP_022840012.1 Tryptophan synthase beta subunit-like PLP-dependent enzymes superfamily [Ostreococcus tauri]
MDDDLAFALALQAQEEEYATTNAHMSARDEARDDEDDSEDDDDFSGKKKTFKPRATAKTKNSDDVEEDEEDETIAMKSRSKRGTRDGKVIMQRLLEHGLVKAGENALTTKLFNDLYFADLMTDGTIVWKKKKQDTTADPPTADDVSAEVSTAKDDAGAEFETLTFNTVTEFRLAVSRLRNPDRKMDNGWDWVKYNDVKIGDLKRQLPPEPEAEPKAPRARREAKAPTPKKRKKKAGKDEKAYQASISKQVIPARTQRASRNASRGLVFSEESGGDLQMVTCEKYTSKQSQPFKITMTSAAELVMDFHAHLSSDEIAGLLGGVYDAESKTLRITRAIPARQLQQENAGVEVEIDLVCIPEIAETLEKLGERVVGWYHSHPVFATQPSMRDIENQNIYQEMFAREDEPFIGAIVGPYDVRNASSTSDVRMFHCVDIDGEPEPYELHAESAGCVDVPVGVMTELKQLADRFRFGSGDAEPLAPVDLNVTPVLLTEHWRDGATRLEKVQYSLAARLPKSWKTEQRDAYAGGVTKYLKTSWGITN